MGYGGYRMEATERRRKAGQREYERLWRMEATERRRKTEQREETLIQCV